MASSYEYETDEEFERRRAARRARWEAERKKRRQKQKRIRIAILAGLAIALLLILYGVICLLGAIWGWIFGSDADEAGDSAQTEASTGKVIAESIDEDIADLTAGGLHGENTENSGYGTDYSEQELADLKAKAQKDADGQNADGAAGGKDALGGNGAAGGADAAGGTDAAGSGPKTINAADFAFDKGSAGGMNNEEVTSTFAIMVNQDDKKVIASKGGFDKIYPASMTKIMTLLVAADYVTNLDDTFTMTRDITDYAYKHDCSSVGFEDGEVVKVRDLLYGTILPSGGDAALGLATYCAGSHEAFVKLMNDKLAALGLSDTAHFTNCVGIFEADHYCTLYDMAVILGAAMQNDLCRNILGAGTYVTSSTTQHPEGIEISNWFMRRIVDKDCKGKVLGAKTGYVVQSGNCAASACKSEDGKTYICVTANAHSSWRAIYDHVAAYNIYAAGNTGYKK